MTRGGDAIAAAESFRRGTAAGWFRRAGGEAVLLTAAHILPPFAADVHMVRLPSREPFARVIAADPALDACLALPLRQGDVIAGWPGIDRPPAFGAPVAGRAVIKIAASGIRRGRIVAAGWRHDRVPGDLLIDSEDGLPFGMEGDSGAILIDREANAIAGMYLGEAYAVDLGGRRHRVLWRGQSIGRLQEAFALGGTACVTLRP
jgi:hypothetical protein